MVLSLDKWVGKIAVVTGASSGIGAAISKLLVENGIIVVGLARRSEAIEEHAIKLADQPGKLIAVKTDMRVEEDIVNAFAWIKENLGPVHILINNAGISREHSILEGDSEPWRETIDINFLGLCIATREAFKIMKDNDINGQIINMNSISGHKVVNVPGINVYSAVKHAVTAVTGTVRNELLGIDSKIKITSLSPGLVKSEMTLDNPLITEDRLRFFASVPILQSEDIADAVGYILSTPENVQINELTITPVGEKM